METIGKPSRPKSRSLTGAPGRSRPLIAGSPALSTASCDSPLPFGYRARALGFAALSTAYPTDPGSRDLAILEVVGCPL